MQRFAQSDLFDQLAESRKLTPDLMRDLTDVIAGFHAAAEITADHGGRTSIEETMAGNNVNLVQSSPPLDGRQIHNDAVFEFLL
jgi:aminoglycoside phosphotransferase family enzyme